MKLTPIAVFIFSLSPALVMAQENNSNVIGKNGHSIMVVSKEDLAKARQYWTQERLNKATPKEEFDAPEAKATKSGKEAAPLKRPKIIAKGTPPKNATVKTVQAGVPTEADVNEIPFSHAGKLYFTEGDGTSHSCTAQFVGPLNLLVTAAHCVRDKETGKYYTNFKFHQGYRQGEETDKVYGIAATTQESWVVGSGNDTNRGVDYGFIITETDSTTGTLGLMINLPYDEWSSIGYPTNYSDGKILQQVKGSYAGMKGDDVVLMADNPYGSGASGGAWVAELTPGSFDGNYMVGNNASHAHNDPTTDHGPYYDEAFESLFDDIAAEAQKLQVKK